MVPSLGQQTLQDPPDIPHLVPDLVCEQVCRPGRRTHDIPG